MTYNTPELEWEQQYFIDYPYAVELFNNCTCTDSYRTDSLSHAQAKYDSLKQDLLNTNDIKMFKYNAETGTHDEIDYNGNIIGNRIMTDITNKDLYKRIEELLRQSISDDYTGTILNSLYGDIAEDIEASADVEFNDDDIRLAIGRVLIDRLELN